MHLVLSGKWRQRSFSRLFYEIFCFLHPVGLQKILALLTSGELDVQIHAVKVVANLAAEGK